MGALLVPMLLSGLVVVVVAVVMIVVVAAVVIVVVVVLLLAAAAAVVVVVVVIDRPPKKVCKCPSLHVCMYVFIRIMTCLPTCRLDYSMDRQPNNGKPVHSTRGG